MCTLWLLCNKEASEKNLTHLEILAEGGRSGGRGGAVKESVKKGNRNIFSGNAE